MKREQFAQWNLDKEILDFIMAENGKDIEKTKEKYSLEADNYKIQLETAQNALKEFEGIDVEELKGKIKTLTDDLANKEAEYQNRIADMEFNNTLNAAIKSFGAKNEKAVIPFLDLDTLKASKNQAEDIKAALTQVKTDNDYLFESQEPFRNPVGASNPPPSGKMTLQQTMAYKNLHPEVDIKSLI